MTSILRTSLALLAAVIPLTACDKIVPLADDDLDNPIGCPTAQQEGQPCGDEGVVCSYSADCGVETLTCSGGAWLADRCEPVRHCPCLSDSDCDTGGSCLADGTCATATAVACGGPDMACCGGFCGTCAGEEPCDDSGVCTVEPGGLGARCDSDDCGDDDCDPGLYCPDSCEQCPCIDTCHAQIVVCVVGMDQTCNVDAMDPTPHGSCVATDGGPLATHCECLPGFTIDPQTGTCL